VAKPSTDIPTEITYQDDTPVVALRSAELRVVKGPDQGRSCALELERVRVGSGADNDLVLTDSRVSRNHAEFQVNDLGYLVVDLGSTNGTFYRGSRVREAIVVPGAEVRLGGTILRLDRGAERSEVIKDRATFGTMIGSSPAMRTVYGLLAKVAPTDMTVLVQGETGTGKELVAEELHRQSDRAGHPFCVVDCCTLPATLVESELFGHKRGAFSGAFEDREGLFERTRGGTVFLDEIGELELEMQTRLLRVLDQRTVRRVGCNVSRKVDFRLIAATNRDLAAEVKQGRFRQDLYFRLAVIRVKLPALRDRGEDVRVLARHFLWQAGCPDPDEVLVPEVVRVMRTRRWPGNVRELRNFVEQAMLAVDGVPLPEDELSPPATPAAEPTPVAETSQWLASVLPREWLEQPYKQLKETLVDQLEALYLGRLLERHGENISRIARDAGVDRSLVRILLRKHGLIT
jgi:DNA-binding NtrC family response regulator